MPFQNEDGDWVKYRSRFGLTPSDECDFHFGPGHPSTSYQERMANVTDRVEDALRAARENGRPYVMFIHGRSTSRPGRTTARSQVRRFMRSKFATPFIERGGCVQHESVFVAKIRCVR
jgi:hypothetical protein